MRRFLPRREAHQKPSCTRYRRPRMPAPDEKPGAATSDATGPCSRAARTGVSTLEPGVGQPGRIRCYAAPRRAKKADFSGLKKMKNQRDPSPQADRNGVSLPNHPLGAA